MSHKKFQRNRANMPIVIPVKTSVKSKFIAQIDLPDIDITQLLGEGRQSYVYKAQKGDQTVAIKLCKSESEAKTQSILFRREAAFLASLQDPSLPKILDVGESDGLAYFIEEFIEGKSLHHCVREKVLSDSEIISIAIALTKVLSKVHQRGLIHRDIKPKNILIDKYGKPFLIDFGLATRVSDETSSKEDIAGTLDYCSPEQLRMITRPVDRRSDLYSFGAVLFECATGRPPFESSDISELVKQHTFTKPKPLYELNPLASKALNNIVMKLLAKDPDDRYQSADSLLSDLINISAIDSKLSQGEMVELGIASVSDHQPTEKELVGRTQQYNELLASYQKAELGQGNIILVEAPSGMGKTRLIRELLNKAENSGGFTLVGKCAQSGNALPFAPLREAVDSYLMKIKMLPDDEREKNYALFRSAMGRSRHLFKNFTPFIRDVFDSNELGPDIKSVTLEQFYSGLAEFLSNFSRTFGKGILFIDDIQWIDESTRVVLRLIKEKLPTTPLLIVVSARNDLVHEKSGMDFIKDMGASTLKRIKLLPLERQDIRKLIEHQLGDYQVDESLLSWIDERSSGIPFAIGEYLRALVDSGQLTPNWGVWRLREEGLNSLNVPNDVIDVILQRVDSLSPQTKDFLKHCSLWGNKFPTTLLGAICGFTENQLEITLAEAAQNNLIENDSDVGVGSFNHDRIQEAFLFSIDDSTKPKFHQKIAEKIVELRTSPDQYIYEITDHFEKGTPEKNPLNLYNCLILAGKKALSEFAAEDSLRYFEQAKKYRDKFRFNTTIEVLRLHAEACSLVGRYQEALDLFNQVLSLSSDRFERAKVHNRLARIFQFRREIQKSWSHAMMGLAEIGQWRSTFPPLQIIQVLFYFVRGLLIDAFGAGQFKAKGTELERNKISAELYEVASVTSYFLNDPWKFISTTWPSIYPAVRIGPSRELVVAYAAFAAGFGVMGLPFIARHYIQKSLSIANLLGDPFVLARSQLIEVYIKQFCGSWVEARSLIDTLLKNQSQYLEGNDFMNATYGGTSCMTMLSGYQDHSLRAMEMAEEFLSWSEPNLERRKGHPFLSTLIQILASKDRVAEASVYIRSIKAEVDQCPDDVCGILGFNGSLLGLYYETKEVSSLVDEAIQKGMDISPIWPPLCMPHFKFFYVFAAFARVNQFFAARTDIEKSNALSKLKTQCRILKFASLMPSWTPLKAHVSVIYGILANIEKKYAKANKLFDRALQQADLWDMPLIRYEVYRQKAHMSIRTGSDEAAAGFAQMALGLAENYNWKLKAKWILSEFEKLSLKKNRSSTTQSVSNMPMETRSLDVVSTTPLVEGIRKNQQLETLIQMCLGSIGGLDFKVQSAKLLDQIVNFFGAERGYVFICPSLDSTEYEYLVGRDNLGQEILKPEEFSTTAVRRALDLKLPLISDQNSDGGLISGESVMGFNLRSIIAAPLIVRDQLLGVIYLDNRSIKGVFQERDKLFLTSAASIMAAAIESARAAASELEKDSLKRDLQLTGAVQLLLLPKAEELTHGRIQINGFLRAATQASGDWWWSERLPDGSSFTFVGDVTGHGPASAMVTAIVAGINYAIQNTLLSEENFKTNPKTYSPEYGIGQFLELVDKNLSTHVMGKLLMCYTAVHWTQDGTLTVWGAGTPAIAFQADGTSELSLISCYGNPLGTGEYENKPNYQKKAQFGRLLIYSDGLNELTDPRGRNISERAITKWFNEDFEKPVSHFIERVTDIINKNAKKNPLNDDVTFVLMKNSVPISVPDPIPGRIAS